MIFKNSKGDYYGIVKEITILEKMPFSYYFVCTTSLSLYIGLSEGINK